MLSERAELDDAVASLVGPVEALLDAAVERLPSSPPIRVRLGAVDGFYALDGQDLVLSERLAGPGVAHPDEPVEAMPPLDRWRRAAGSILEALALNGLGRAWRRRPGRDWRWMGCAIDLADRAAPDLELAQPDVALAIRTGDPGAKPRCGVAVLRHSRWAGESMNDRVGYLLTGGVISPSEWADIGQWVMDPEGAGATLPVVVRHPEPIDVPADLDPWSWRPLHVPAHPRGGVVEVEGAGFVVEPWAPGGQVLRTLACATEGGARLSPRTGGPVGRWELASAQGFGQVFGARGVVFDFKGSGRLQVVLADAFVGPLAAVAMAEEVGTSGTADGRWRVAGRFLIDFEGIVPSGLTMHSRGGEGFMVPAGSFGLGEWLKALEESQWAWQATDGERLVMRGQMMGGPVEVRLKPA